VNTAVLFLVFNRPDETVRSFAAIRAARPSRLYVAADGARAARAGEAERCAEVRRIATAVDWPCEVHTLFRDDNLGCRRAVGGALDWFFDAEPEGIVLEDDCVAGPDWFRFAEAMLDRYRDDERIMCVSASHFHGDAHQPPASYFFSRYNHCWGWASWRRAWRLYDPDMRDWPRLRSTAWLRQLGDGSTAFAHYWTRVFDAVAAQRGIDSWAYRWTFACWKQGALTVLPARNLVSNLGFTMESTHTGADSALKDATPLESLDFPLRHPAEVVRDRAADLWTDRHIYRIGLRSLVRGMAVDAVRRLGGRAA
jgi:hypothetical protein